MVELGRQRVLSVALLTAGSFLAVVPAVSGARKAPRAEPVRRLSLLGPRSIADRGDSLVRVTVLVKSRDSAFAQLSRRQDAIVAAPALGDRAMLRVASARYVHTYASAQEQERWRALRAIWTARRADPSVKVYRTLRGLGGRITAVSRAGGTVTMLMPRRALRALERAPGVQAVERTPVMRDLDIGMNSASVGAPVWWAAGFTGGVGASDQAATLAVDQDPVLRSHPAFRGIEFETPTGIPEPTSPSLTRHGTALLSMVAARGPSACLACNARDAEEIGVSPGVNRIRLGCRSPIHLV
jgi:hypothetical protein